MVMSILSAVCAGGQTIYDSIATSAHADAASDCSGYHGYFYGYNFCQNVSLEQTIIDYTLVVHVIQKYTYGCDIDIRP